MQTIRNASRGFTIVELLVVIAIIAIMSTLMIVVYRGINHRADDARVVLTVAQATDTLEIYYTKQRDYPPNLAGTGYVAPEVVSITLYTNAPQQRVHTNLTPDQNAQLLLNACNANMPIVISGVTYNTGCMFAGNNFHVKGKDSSNVVLQGPEVTESSFQLACGTVCDTVRQAITNQFTGQGGQFPIYVPKGNVAMPESTLETYGRATNFCLEARSIMHDDIAYHTRHDNTEATSGPCPANPELHYP